MALDRQSIEKTDFPTGSHGYDPQAVEAHLSALADEIAEFKSASRRRGEAMASSASDQVRAIIEAAEASAAEIQRSAEVEAREIREEAHHEARAARENATQEIGEHVGRVSEATGAMLGRLDGMESELSSLLETLRSGAGRLDADLRQLGSELEHVSEQAKPPVQAEFQPDPPPVPEPVPAPPAPRDGGDSWGSSSATGDWAAQETTPTGSAQAAEDTGSDTTHPSPSESGWGESAESGGGAAPPWDSGESSPGWGTPEGDATDSGAAESYSPHDPAPAADGWSSRGPESAPAAPREETFPDSQSAPPGPSDWAGGTTGAPSPDGEPSSASFGAPGPGAAAPHDPGTQDEEADDSEGARLIALNMALNGTPRDETARYLSENFQLSDRDGLLDEVYASVEG